MNEFPGEAEAELQRDRCGSQTQKIMMWLYGFHFIDLLITIYKNIEKKWNTLQFSQSLTLATSMASVCSIDVQWWTHTRVCVIVYVATGSQALHSIYWEHWSSFTGLHACACLLAEMVDYKINNYNKENKLFSNRTGRKTPVDVMSLILQIRGWAGTFSGKVIDAKRLSSQLKWVTQEADDGSLKLLRHNYFHYKNHETPQNPNWTFNSDLWLNREVQSLQWRQDGLPVLLMHILCLKRAPSWCPRLLLSSMEVPVIFFFTSCIIGFKSCGTSIYLFLILLYIYHYSLFFHTLQYVFSLCISNIFTNVFLLPA